MEVITPEPCKKDMKVPRENAEVIQNALWKGIPWEYLKEVRVISRWTNGAFNRKKQSQREQGQRITGWTKETIAKRGRQSYVSYSLKANTRLQMKSLFFLIIKSIYGLL